MTGADALGDKRGRSPKADRLRAMQLCVRLVETAQLLGPAGNASRLQALACSWVHREPAKRGFLSIPVRNVSGIEDI
jgi:hypothetical protein